MNVKVSNPHEKYFSIGNNKITVIVIYGLNI